MSYYTFQIVGIEPLEGKYYYRVRINQPMNSVSREVRVKYSDLANLHRRLQDENYSYMFPPFPERQMMQSFFKAIDSKEELEEYQEKINAYLMHIAKNAPIKLQAIIAFVQDSYDPIRQGELKIVKLTKEQLWSQFVQTALLKKGKLNKVYRVSDKKVTLILQTYLLPDTESAKQDFESYRKSQLLIDDFTFIVKVFQIGEINKAQGMIKRFFNAKQKRSVYQEMNISPDQGHKYFYTVEEFCGNSLHTQLNNRKDSSNYWDIDFLTEILLTLVQVAMYLNFLGVNNRCFRLSQLFYSDQGLKVGGITPINNYKLKYKNRIINDVETQVLTPPEQQQQLGLKIQQASIKCDVWQIGIIMLSLATLSHTSDLFESIEIKLSMVQQLYGESFSLLIKSMLERSPYDRLSLQDILVQYQNVLPIKLNFFNLPSKKIQRIKINSLTKQDLENLDKFLNEKTDMFTVTVNLEKNFNLFYLSLHMRRLVTEYVYMLTINIVEIINDQLRILINNIAEFKTLKTLILNMSFSNIKDLGDLLILNNSSITKLYLDIRGCDVNYEIVKELKMQTKVYNDI